ncbi:MAG: ABC transporter ATP-binding protein [Phycisphaerales bacterium]|nr:ABC transporter ATP-binding protein [Phycisphaerales bacterium]
MSIETKQVQFRYTKGPLVLKGISCTIRSGAITAIVGPNGSGKSTLIRLLAGLRTPESGRIELNSQSLSAYAHTDRARQIAFIEQRPNLAFDFSVRRVVEFGTHAIGSDRQRIDDALVRFELAEIPSKPYGHLSVGQQQRVSIARAWVQIAGNPSGYLLADEPCSAMDPKHALQSMGAFEALAQTGIGIGVVIHDLTSAARWADDAIVLNQVGELAAQGSASDILTEDVLSAVFDVQIRRHELAGGRWALIPDQD